MATKLPRVFLDYETRSRCDLKKCGGRVYAWHPSTEVLCCVLHVDGLSYTYRHEQDHTPIVDLLEACAPFAAVAHNGIGFDRHVWARLGWPEPAEWIDPAELARVAGYPRAGLDWLGANLLGVPKDHEGNRLTLSLSQVNKKTGDWRKQLTPEILDRVVAYCRADVELMVRLYEEFLAQFEGIEPELVIAERAVIDRGIRFDVQLADKLIWLNDAWAEAARRQTAGVFEVPATGEQLPVEATALRSNKQLVALFAELGVDIADCRGETIEKLCEHEDQWVAALAQARLAAVPIAAKKLRAAKLRLSPDGRLRDSLRYYGADRTGRWAGVGFQPQNLPRGIPFEDENKRNLVNEACARVLADDYPDQFDEDPVGAISTLARSCLVAEEGHTLSVVDLGQIESRCIMWAARDEGGIYRFEQYDRKLGPDPYKVMGGRVYNIPPEQCTKLQRNVGKPAVLACAYGMGPAKFRATALASPGFPGWEALPMTPEQVVAAWRELHAPVVRWWYKLQEGFVQAARGGKAEVWPVTFHPMGQGDVWCELPSGRCLIYRRVQAMRTNRGWDLTYAAMRGYEKDTQWACQRTRTYGGKIAENIIQAMSRDFLAEAIVALAKAGLPCVLHVHDETVCELRKEDARIQHAEHCAIMVRVPVWAPGMPLVADGFLSDRYHK